MVSSTPVILAVIFQSDLRRALLAIGRRTSSISEYDGDIETVEELIKALRELADKQIGALIVLVRQIPIDHIVHVGTEIDAKVTCELLNSIFLPYSPIHDGAVIIEKGNRPRRVACCRSPRIRTSLKASAPGIEPPWGFLNCPTATCW